MGKPLDMPLSGRPGLWYPPGMDRSRRQTVKALVAAALLPLAAPDALARAQAPPCKPDSDSPLSVMVPRDYRPPVSGQDAERYQFRLGRAVLDFLETEFTGRTMPVWGRRFDDVDMEKRVVNIAHWVVRSVQAHSGTHPVDPAWVMAQIMAESFYYEFAVSRAMAVGICQFIAPTAREYGMTTAGDLEKHHTPPLQKTQWAGELERYYARRQRWKQAMRRRNAIAPDPRAALEDTARALSEGLPWPMAGEYLRAQSRVDELDAQVKESRTRFQDYLAANFQGRSIFNKADVRFFKTFDERVLYRKPVDAMVLMLARALKARQGYILAAAAGYHAGLSLTREDDRLYGRYGRIPAIGETVTYVSRVLVNHFEITRRI